MKTLRWFFCAVMLLAFSRAGAQIQLGVIIDSFPTSWVLGDTSLHTGSIYIKNYSLVAFGGDSVYLQYKVNGVTYNATNASEGIYLAKDTFSIGPGDSVKKQLQIHFTPTIFQFIGSSGVVIWPISAGSTPYDSASCQVQVNYPANIANTGPDDLKVYMDHQQLFVNYGGQNIVKRVRIYDVEGQLLEDKTFSSSPVVTDNQYALGYYMVVITLNDDTRRVFKVANLAAR